MKKLTIQKICCIYPKNEYRREGDTFIKGNMHCKCSDQIIQEFDDCWITLSQPKEVIGEIINKWTSEDNYWLNHYASNIVDVNILYNKIKPNTEFLYQHPTFMEAAMYGKTPVIKAKFRFYSVIISEDLA